MISFAIRLRLPGVAEKTGLRHDQRVAEPAGLLHEIRDRPVALVRRAANHQRGIDAHVDDAAVLGEAALRHEALHQANGVFDREIAGSPRRAGKRSVPCVRLPGKRGRCQYHGSLGAIGGDCRHSD